MSRKPPKRAGERSAPPTTERLVELAQDITSDTIVMGPQDIVDIREGLLELIRRRNTHRFANPIVSSEEIAA